MRFSRRRRFHRLFMKHIERLLLRLQKRLEPNMEISRGRADRRLLSFYQVGRFVKMISRSAEKRLRQFGRNEEDRPSSLNSRR
jgi:hypothetical protein